MKIHHVQLFEPPKPPTLPPSEPNSPAEWNEPLNSRTSTSDTRNSMNEIHPAYSPTRLSRDPFACDRNSLIRSRVSPERTLHRDSHSARGEREVNARRFDWKITAKVFGKIFAMESGVEFFITSIRSGSATRRRALRIRDAKERRTMVASSSSTFVIVSRM